MIININRHVLIAEKVRAVCCAIVLGVGAGLAWNCYDVSSFEAERQAPKIAKHNAEMFAARMQVKEPLVYCDPGIRNGSYFNCALKTRMGQFLSLRCSGEEIGGCYLWKHVR